MVLDPALLDWLLDADPALRWQVERDLAGTPQEDWGATRARIATEGFGARLLALPDPDGQWAGGSYFPSDFDFHGPEAADDAGQPWTATTWTLNTPRDWGLDAAALAGTADLPAANSRWDYDDLPYWGGEVDWASTPTRSPTARGSGRMSRESPNGSSTAAWPMVAGTASGSRARPAHRSIPPSPP